MVKNLSRLFLAVILILAYMFVLVDCGNSVHISQWSSDDRSFFKFGSLILFIGFCITAMFGGFDNERHDRSD